MIIKENEIDSCFENYIPTHLRELFIKNFIVLDIETTGFSRQNASIILIGIIIKNENHLITKQIFAESLDEEVLILSKLIEVLESLDDYFFITYNGHSFDLPFINSKLNQYGIEYQLNLNNNFDLYRLIRKNKKLLNLERHNLKTVEKFLGIKRNDTISGRESIQLYYNYLESNSSAILNKILLHNYEDIKYLLPLLEILKHFSYNQIMVFYPKKIGENYFLDQWKIHNNFLKISLTGNKQYRINYYDEFCTIQSKENNLMLKIALKEIQINDMKYHLVNHKVFYNEKFEALNPQNKNDLIISIKREIQFEKLIYNINKILKKYNIKKSVYG